MKTITNIKFLKILIIALFVIFVSLQANKPLVLDEIDFPIVSKATSETMKPVYYRGEDSPSLAGLYHPTLYINSLALFIKAVGFSEISVRLFGAVCTLITAYLLIRIFRFFKNGNETGEVLLLGLFLLNPYTLASTTLPDIDSTVLPVVFLLFIYLSLRYIWQEKRSDLFIILSLGSVFALNLWAKLTTPLVLPFFIFFLLLVCKKDFKKALLNSVWLTLLGAGMFLATYYLYCSILSLPFSYTFSFLVHSFTKGTASDVGLMEKMINNFSNIKAFVYWFTIPLAFLYVISFIGMVLEKSQNVEEKIVKILAFLSFSTLIFYLGLISPFGGFFKYPYPVFGLILLCLVIYFQKQLSEVKPKLIYIVITFMAVFFVGTRYFRDNMFKDWSQFYNLHILVILALLAYLAIKVYRQNKVTGHVLWCIFIAVIAFQASITRVQATAPYPTKYHYGLQGNQQTISYLKTVTRENEIIWSMKDIGYYVNNKYIENYSFFYNSKKIKDLENLIENGKVRYYVATTGIGEDRIDVYEGVRDVLESKATKVATFENYIIYKAK